MIKILCLAALCLTAVAGFPKKERIINGSPTTIDQYPFMAGILESFTSGYSHNCGGTIINNRSVLTASHCIHDRAVSRIAVRVGSTLANSGGYVHNAASLILHSDYSTVLHVNDIGIIRVTTAFSFGVSVQVGRLAGPNYNLEDNQAVWAVGWGYSGSYLRAYLEELLHVQLSVVNQNICRLLYGVQGNARTICAGGGGSGVCSGDSGGPLVHNNVVVGVVSLGHQPCGSLPAVYARVSSYTNWIQQNA